MGKREKFTVTEGRGGDDVATATTLENAKCAAITLADEGYENLVIYERLITGREREVGHTVLCEVTDRYYVRY